MERIYICIDLKTFYASVECVERKLDPFKTNLIVANPSRGRGAICLAISPKMKAQGVKNRCRVFEIPKNIKYVTALPRMKKYIEYSAMVYRIYLKYIGHDDIHVYSIDEAFLDVTSYLKMYNCQADVLAKNIMRDILKTTGVTATAGIGTNLYLAKVALDIMAKHEKTNIAYLDEERYKKLLWHHRPLSDFWQIGKGIERRLNKLGLFDMHDVSFFDAQKLRNEFGVNAELIMDHANGVEPVTMQEIKSYKPKHSSISSGQTLFTDYDYKAARKVLIEMVDSCVLDLKKREMLACKVGFLIGYSKDVVPPLKVFKTLGQATGSYAKILSILLREYDERVNKKIPVRRLCVSFGKLGHQQSTQLDLFMEHRDEKNDLKVQDAVNKIKNKYGKNAILRGVSYEKEATQITRNKLIGGHNAE